MRKLALLWLAFLALLVTACGGAVGNGTVLAPQSGADVKVGDAERAGLAAGRVVTRPLEFERGSSRYVGGVAYGVVATTPDRILAAIDDVGALRSMLPRTKRATLIEAAGTVRRIELLQGNSFIDATYTVSLEPSDVPGEVRFRLDRSRHHDIDDVYGYFKVERFDDGRSLVTVAAAVDVGSDFTTLLFGKRVQDVILSTPYAMRDYFARSDVRSRDFRLAANAPR